MTFIGNATTLLRLGTFTLLTDPAFGQAGSRVYLGYGAWTLRPKDPAMSYADLPSLDLVLLSHLHGDHFDRAARRALPSTLPIVTTPQAQRRLRRDFTATGLPAAGSAGLSESVTATAASPQATAIPAETARFIERRTGRVCRSMINYRDPEVLRGSAFQILHHLVGQGALTPADRYSP
ncbi:MBL fold metallo-hydrolase [Actinoplanes campanulatus]|uniref:MBL fold metallo-hydrolase n=1 Tax=Actinoplanes campanulatus TaxID=113559 RepID=UPI001EF25EE5|nr:MBL fold metallo-hydrolase [Actinoplanes capillaceus]